MNDPHDPRPVIRAVLLAGFFGGNLCGMLYMAARGVLLEGLSLNPLAMLGGFLAVGLVGMMGGGMCGLALTLALEKSGTRRFLWMPVVTAAVVSGVIGTVIVYALVGLFW